MKRNVSVARFKFRFNILISGKIIKEIPVSVASGTLCITLVNDQLDAQLFYFIICLLQSSTCFEQRRVHHQEVKLY